MELWQIFTVVSAMLAIYLVFDFGKFIGYKKGFPEGVKSGTQIGADIGTTACSEETMKFVEKYKLNAQWDEWKKKRIKELKEE